MAARAKISGLDKLIRKFQQLPPRAEKEIRLAMEAGADEVVTLAKSLAPLGKATGRDSSNNPGRLRDSIGWVWGGSVPKGSIKLGSVSSGSGRRPGDLVITIFAGDDKAFYARWVEFGTRPHTIKAKDAPTLTRAGINFGTSVSHPGASTSNAFFYPAYRALRKKIKARISRAVNKSARDVANSS
jgi:HK97 gp10 family phage protein